LNQCLNSEWAKGLKDFSVNWWYWRSFYEKSFSKDEVKEWNILNLTWSYKFDAKLDLSDEDKAVLDEKWWVIVPEEKIKDLSTTFLSYDEEKSEEIVSSP
jgi:hypothetical protein